MRFRDKIALVTGASKGIGRTLAINLAKEGAHILLAARNIERLEEVDDQIKQYGARSTIIPVDLSDFGNIYAMALDIKKRFDRLDILVGNAGILGEVTPVNQIDAEIFTRVMNINFYTNWHLIRAFDPIIKLSKHPRELFVTSGAATKMIPFFGAYAASKAALDTIVKTYAAENILGAIKINLISPGPIATEMRKEAMPGEDQKNLKTPQDIIHYFLDLLDDDCKITGQIIKCQE
jgi:NAD(P)-dependent dehydrogenase (short-subunit alcohol dehydrogenase family)